MPGWSARELDVIARLRELGDAATPDAETRERIRARIRRQRATPDPAWRRRRIANALAGVAALLIALAGLGVLLSQNSMPGDPFYSIKRIRESAELGLTFGDAARADKHLRFASARLRP